MFRFYLFLTLLLTTNNGFAIGLSDITLKSNMGEPLGAHVMINDVETAPDLSCFLVKEMNGETALKRINARLVENNQKYQLNISTGTIVSEPIVNLSVNYVCEPNFSRSYVLLLDPAPLPLVVGPTATTIEALSANAKTTSVNNKSADKSQAANQQTSTNGSNAAGDSASANTTLNALTADNNVNGVATKQTSNKTKKRKAKKANRLPLASNQTSADAKLMEAYVGKTANPSEAASQNKASEKQNTQTTPEKNSKPTSAKPYLVISGGALNGGAPYDSSQTGLTLQLETEIDFNRVAEPTLAPSNEETLDEVTVMANRLAHLEKQILGLQSTNMQLKAQVIEAENAGFKLSPTQQHWLKYAGIILGILALIAIIEFARRQFLRHRLKRDEAIWFIDNEAEPSLNNEDADDHFDTLNSGNYNTKTADNAFNQTANMSMQPIEPSMFNENNVANSATAQLNINTQSAAEQEVENVLDHADVFIAHGRTGLAIQLLQNHLEEFPTESPAVWLKLLGLLAAENSESDYEMAVTECNQFFNIKLPSYAEALNEDESSIENHPHIVSRLEGVWGSQYAIGFLNDLIYNQQSQPREGFARNTFNELFFLRQISQILQSDLLPEGTTNIYRAESVQPVLEKVAVNAAIFGNVAATNPAVSMATADNVNVENSEDDDVLFDAPVTQNVVADASALNTSNNTEMNITSFAADEFKEDFNNGKYEMEILLEAEPVEATVIAPMLEESVSAEAITSLPAMTASESLPEIVFASEEEQNMVENIHFEAVIDAEATTNNMFDDGVITEEIDFSSVGSVLEDTALEEISPGISLLTEEENNALAFDASTFKEISNAVKASMLEKSADELAEVYNSNMIEFDWDLPDAAETPPNNVKASKKATKK